MSDTLDKHLEEAFASLDDLTMRELAATAEALGRRRDVLRTFSSDFRDVAFARGGREARLARFHLHDCVSRADEELAEQIESATAPFWAHVPHVRDAVALISGDD